MILVLAGPTSAGKTEVALQIAERFGAVILSADAMQVYRGLDIGTGKATAEERARILHLGIDVVEIDQPFSAGDFVALGDRAVAEHPRVVVAGGTSLYLRALLRGLVETPPVDLELRARLEALDDPHAELLRIDPVLAERLHPRDTLRLVRGLEVFYQTGQLLSELQAEHARAPDRIPHRALWLDRDDLNDRIDARVHQMIASGYVEEVRGVLGAGFDRHLKPLRSLGYRHLCDHLLDGVSLGEAVRRTQRDTRRFARKQRTWMRGLGLERVTSDHLQRALAEARRCFGVTP